MGSTVGGCRGRGVEISWEKTLGCVGMRKTQFRLTEEFDAFYILKSCVNERRCNMHHTDCHKSQMGHGDLHLNVIRDLYLS